MRRVDVAILGGGFGGTLTALLLERIGLRPLVLDEGRHPRFAIGESSTPIGNLILADLAREYGLSWLAPLARYGSWVRTYPDVIRGPKRGFSYFQHLPDLPFLPVPEHTNELLVAASQDLTSADTHWFRSDVDRFLAEQVQAAGIPYLDQVRIRIERRGNRWVLTCHGTADGGIPNSCSMDAGSTELGAARSPAASWQAGGTNGGDTGGCGADGCDTDECDTEGDDTGGGDRWGSATVWEADLLIDASGAAAAVPRALGIPLQTDGFRTHSRAIFGHFTGVAPWQELLEAAGGRTSDHPFPCDQAALHHLLPDGWMWQLRFDNRVTSCGIVFDDRRRPGPDGKPIGARIGGSSEGSSGESAEHIWRRVLDRFPSLAAQFRDSRLVAPAGGLRSTGRLQRRAAAMAGPGWVLLPHTCGFIDPLHSTGIAHTLAGVERLLIIVRDHWGRGSLQQALAEYARTVRDELDLIDRLVSLAYCGLPSFPLFTSACMLYFAAATTYESRRLAGLQPAGAAFLRADDPDFRHLVIKAGLWREQMRSPDPAVVDSYCLRLAESLAPYNIAGLCDPASRNMYRYTAVPSDGHSPENPS